MQRTTCQRVGPAAALPALLTELGIPHDSVFAGFGLAPEQLMPDARYPLADLIALLERAAKLADCPHLGLLLGSRQDHRCLGAVGQMMSRAPTLGDALRDYVGVQMGYSRGAVVYLHRIGNEYRLGYGLYDAGAVAGRQVYDLVIALGCNFIRSLTEGRVRPLRVLQCCAVPDKPDRYRTATRTAISFDQEETCIVLAEDDMNVPLPRADAAERLQLRQLIAAAMDNGEESIAARVRHSLRPRLMIGEATRDRVARDLGYESRTLSRRLKAAGTSFELIKDQVRFNVARELLALTHMPVGSIGESLSYSTNSAFDHAFQRWAGISPSKWRALQDSAPA